MHVQDGAYRRARSCSVGKRNGTPEGLDALLGAADALAMVASGTRNALAISLVVRPPTALNVSAIAED
jgi:hypothetical protein